MDGDASPDGPPGLAGEVRIRSIPGPADADWRKDQPMTRIPRIGLVAQVLALPQIFVATQVFVATQIFVPTSAFTAPLAAATRDTGQTAALPVGKTPFHVYVFQNRYVRLVNANIPPGRSAPYHRHTVDFAFVVVEAATVKAQAPGGEPLELPQRAGAVSYAGYTKKPATHQVFNVDTKPYHVVGIEILNPTPGRFTLSRRADVSDYKLVLDNERVRGWDLTLAPGQSVPAITRKAPGIRIVVSGGELVESGPGQADQELSLKLGDFMWQEANATRALRNAGSTPIELIEFELK
jgi:quercetin dioxygenase-like cupin family protein